jgi:hypothetical protein
VSDVHRLAVVGWVMEVTGIFFLKMKREDFVWALIVKIGSSPCKKENRRAFRTCSRSFSHIRQRQFMPI